MLKSVFKIFFLGGILVFASFSCGVEDNGLSEKIKSQAKKERSKQDKSEKNYTRSQIKELKTASKVAYTLPSPNEMAKILHETEAVYDVEILNDVKNLEQYVSDFHVSLNLGVYFADLSFTSMFDYPQQAMMYMGAGQALSEQLNIDGVFNEELMTRIEDNMGDKDSLMQIVADAYIETDFTLQDDDRPVIAKVILAGSWIEGLYIAVNLKTAEGKEGAVIEKVAQQKPALKNLIKMLEDCNDPMLNVLVLELNDLNKIYEAVELKELKEAEDELAVESVNISPITFSKIKSKIIKIRTKIVKSTI